MIGTEPLIPASRTFSLSVLTKTQRRRRRVRGLEAISGFDEFRSSCSGKHIQHCPSPVGEGARRADEGFPTSRLSPNLTPRPCRVKQRPCVTFGAPQIANTWGRIDSFGAPHPTSAFSKNANATFSHWRRTMK